MIALLPDPGTYGAAVIQGLSATGDVHRRGAVVLRGAFDLVEDGSGVRAMRLADDAARFGLVTADRGSGASGDFDLLQESDFSVEKALADIMVEGFIGVEHGGEHGGAVKVNGAVWRQRIANLPLAARNADTGRNLFGWHRRTETGRSLTGAGDSVPKNTLPLGYSALFNNAYRRSTGFSAPALQAGLPPGALVQVYQTPDASGAAYALRLPAGSYSARLRSAGLDCPDQPKRWAVTATFPLQPDTLILRPNANQAEIVWRADWRWSEFDEKRLRAVQILQVES